MTDMRGLEPAYRNPLFDTVPGIFGGLRIVVSAHHPTEFSHWETVRYPVHPIIKWLARWLPFDTYIEAKYARSKYTDPIMDPSRSILYCAPPHERRCVSRCLDREGPRNDRMDRRRQIRLRPHLGGR